MNIDAPPIEYTLARINPITVVLTSCGRYDLLKQTLDSFFALNTYPIDRFILHEDSMDKDALNALPYIISNYEVEIISPIFSKRGLSKSIDKLYSTAQEGYIVHIEDDWLFHSNPNFIADSIKILEAHPDIHQVWCRDEADHTHPLSEPLEIAGIPCKAALPNYQWHWQGFSWNPHVKRLSDYKRMFPNGYAEFGDEALCSKRANKFGYKAVALINSACKHIGYGRHTEGFKV